MTSAVILAGGLGTRLQRVVPNLPKPMAPINGKPFLEYLLDYWISQGVDKFIFSIGYLHEKIIDHFGDFYCGIRLEYVIERNPLGTGGGFLLGLDKVRNTEYFLLLNGDTFFTVNLQRLRQFSLESNADWCFSLFPTEDTERYMGLELNSEGQITRLAVKSGEGTCLANGGVYWVKTATVLDQPFSMKFPAGTKASLEADIFNFELERGSRMIGLKSEEIFLDIGVPKDYATSFTLFDKSTQS
jgi:D-glycero-alpha-D-manno-heptose 1-phosphate guanylyltransferase